MNGNRIFGRVMAAAGVAVLAAVVVATAPSDGASAATTINGPINLGNATSFGVLGGTTVTNTGASTVGGDLGVSPGSVITGFPPGVVNGAMHPTDSVAQHGEADLTTAYNVAASLTPASSGLNDLVGLTLSPGVYSGGALSLSGDLTLNAGGDPSAVWVFQAASTLVTGSGSHVILTGGANACNVFWQVGSSATLGTGSQFVGSILADSSITADTTAQVTGRLLARVAAVTLDTNTVTVPAGCPDASGTTVSSSPTFTSASSTRVSTNTPLSFRFTAAGSSPSVFTVSAGALPTGVVLNSATGVLSGEAAAAGTYAWSVTASNGIGPAAVQVFSLVVTPRLATTGLDPWPGMLGATALLALGGGLLGMSLRPRRRSS